MLPLATITPANDSSSASSLDADRTYSHHKRSALILAGAVVLVYWLLALVLHETTLEGDEQRYYQDAVNLTNGYFVADDHPRIFNGPGYPFFLYPFVKLGAPYIVIRFTGALMIGLSAWFFFLASRRLMPGRWALAVTAFCSFHPNLLRQGHMLMTEPMTHLFLAVFLWCFVLANQSQKHWKRWALAAAVSIWVLAMTRVFMGHVITVMVIASAVAMVIKYTREAARRTLFIMLGALLLCTPYLRFTYLKTGSHFLWSTSAGELLYWLTSHQTPENGHWYHESEVFSNPLLRERHGKLFEELSALGPLEKEARFKEVALKRIKEEPLEVAKNWVCNVTRLFFGFPRSLEREKITTLPLVMFNGTMLIGLAVGLLLAWLRREPLPPLLWMLLLMSAFYTGGSTLAPALPRYFLGIVPVIAMLAGTVVSRVPWQRLYRD